MTWFHVLNILVSQCHQHMDILHSCLQVDTVIYLYITQCI